MIRFEVRTIVSAGFLIRIAVLTIFFTIFLIRKASPTLVFTVFLIRKASPAIVFTVFVIRKAPPTHGNDFSELAKAVYPPESRSRNVHSCSGSKPSIAITSTAALSTSTAFPSLKGLRTPAQGLQNPGAAGQDKAPTPKVVA
jgi:hypothetical protein